MRKLSLCWRSGSGTSGEESERSSSSFSGFPVLTTEERAASAEITYRGHFDISNFTTVPHLKVKKSS